MSGIVMAKAPAPWGNFRLDDLEPGRFESLPMKKPLHLVVVDEQNHGIGALVIHA